MKRYYRKVLVLAVAVATWMNALGGERVPNMLSKVDGAAMRMWVDSVMNTMTEDERIAQLMVVAIHPSTDAGTRATLARWVSELHVGGLIFEKSTAGDLAATINYAQSKARVPLLTTIDGEWGLAMRLSDAPEFQRNLLLGAVGNDQLLYEYGREVARECLRMGIYVNFAPVLDVNDNAKNPVIGNRSFGESPELVARRGVAYARGLEDGGVLSVGKHFPGHGSTNQDSHKTLPTVDKKMTELNTCELVPFRRYIEAGLSGMLAAHLSVPAIEKKKMPTTMSRRCVTDLLRREMGFTGLVFTDALNMKGATEGMKGSACVNALLAGNDVLLMPSDVAKEIAAVKEALQKGTLKSEDINSHCRRILEYKYALGLVKTPHVNTSGLPGAINTSRAEELKRQMCAASVTVLKNNDNILPAHNLQSRRIAVVTIGDEKGLKSIFHTRAADYAQTTHFNIGGGQSAASVASAIKKGNFNVVLVEVTGEKYRSELNTLAKSCRNIVAVLMCAPYKIDEFGEAITAKNVKAVVLTYENSEQAADYAVQTIFGGNAATGVLPVSLSFKGKKKRYFAGDGIHYNATRLGYAQPSEVGMSNRLLSQVDSVCRLGVSQGAFPGCQVVIGRHGKIICNRAYGKISNASNAPAVTTNTLYDLASVSKATGTLCAVMKVFDAGKFTLDQPASDFIPGLRDGDKSDITFRQLLYHETGMPPSLNMWQMMFDPSTYTGSLISGTQDDMHPTKIMSGAYGNKDAKLRTDILSKKKTEKFNIAIADGIYGGTATYDAVMNGIYNATLGAKKYLYSCLNFSLLADAVQRITNAPLNYFVNNYIFAPLGAYHTLYRPLTRFSGVEIAYTEVDTYLRRQHIHGYVHDELAAFSTGVQGNAGLFSSANDLAKLLQMWLNGGTYGGTRFYQLSTVETFTTQKSPNSHRGLGFDKPVVGNPRASNTCAEATPETYGHTGFTGTCFWVDPANDMFYIFLSNRVCPTRDNANFGRISARSHIQSLIYKSIID